MKNIQVTINRRDLSLADGIYQIEAPGFAKAELFWAGKDKKPIPGWTSFACLVLEEGTASFSFAGKRAVPADAAGIVCALNPKGEGPCMTYFQEIPAIRKEPIQSECCFSVASDLHISNKSMPFQNLYKIAAATDALLLAGDTVNDGTEPQFSFVKDRITEYEKLYGTSLPIFAVTGNHDIPLKPVPLVEVAYGGGYIAFQKWLLNRLSSTADAYEQDASGAYAVPFSENVEIIGLQCVSHFRRFVFRDGEQLKWLSDHLKKNKDLKWHIILCHAPLIHHNPQRIPEKNAPYLSRDEALQSIINAHDHIIFITGHTHFSLNNLFGCVEWDKARKNLYLNAGSIRKTTMKDPNADVPASWTEGNAIILRISGNAIEISTVGVHSGNQQARGTYHFTM